ncbi:RNA-directed DNA polymerase [bacterium]|nr:RNA-directed DNA polymerase [bacterium]
MEQQVKQLKEGFLQMQTKQELADVLNLAKKVLYPNDDQKIELKNITYHGNSKFSKNRYKTFVVKKKSGGERIIQAPKKEFKSILKPLNLVFQTVFEPHKNAFGFVPQKSIVDNANRHVSKNFVYNLDLKDFFHSFDRNAVKMGIWFYGFKMDKTKESLAYLLACLCTHETEIGGKSEFVLPQGNPCSPTLTNLLCTKLDRRLNGLARRFGAEYSRYADDITFSANKNAFKNEDFQKELKRIIEDDQQLEIQPKKTRLQGRNYRQDATGLTVNEKVNVQPRYTKQIRHYLYLWKKYGYNKAATIFTAGYSDNRGHVKSPNAKLENVLSGKLEYLKMVKGEDDSTYQTLKKRFDILANRDVEIEKIVAIWEKEGIEAAAKANEKRKQSKTANKLNNKKFSTFTDINELFDFSDDLAAEKVETYGK